MATVDVADLSPKVGFTSLDSSCHAIKVQLWQVTFPRTPLEEYSLKQSWKWMAWPPNRHGSGWPTS